MLTSSAMVPNDVIGYANLFCNIVDNDDMLTSSAMVPNDVIGYANFLCNIVDHYMLC